MNINKNLEKNIIKNVSLLSMKTRKLALYCNFLSKSKSLNSKLLLTYISEIKAYIEKIENLLN